MHHVTTGALAHTWQPLLAPHNQAAIELAPAPARNLSAPTAGVQDIVMTLWRQSSATSSSTRSPWRWSPTSSCMDGPWMKLYRKLGSATTAPSVECSGGRRWTGALTWCRSVAVGQVCTRGGPAICMGNQAAGIDLGLGPHAVGDDVGGSQALGVALCKAHLGSSALELAPFCGTVWQQALSSCLWGLTWCRSLDIKCFAGDQGWPAGLPVRSGGRRWTGGSYTGRGGVKCVHGC